MFFEALQLFVLSGGIGKVHNTVDHSISGYFYDHRTYLSRLRQSA